jgi:hypothetical protein
MVKAKYDNQLIHPYIQIVMSPKTINYCDRKFIFKYPQAIIKCCQFQKNLDLDLKANLQIPSPTTKMTKKAAKHTPRKEAMNTTIPASMITRQQGEHGEDGYQGAQHEGVCQEQNHPPPPEHREEQ